MRRLFLVGSGAALIANGALAPFHPAVLWSLAVLGPVIAIGLYDILQTRRAVLRNFPLIGHFRYMFEAVRPEISQYFIETDTSGVPFSREQRSLVYQRSKRVRDTQPFGTLRDVYAEGYEWVNHSLNPVEVRPEAMRIMVGGTECEKPYLASRLNISAMSFGSLSKNAILALSRGACMGGFAHNTGEGGLSPYHLEGGADLVWQIGTGYFGCRTKDGAFSAEQFAEKAVSPQVRMIELKLSQGAKPGHGGILPAAKLTREIAEIRGVPMGRDVLSPPAHSAFKDPIGMMGFIARLRELSGGKPVGFKLCVGKRREFLAICKAMLHTGITPDFITVDGGEGGTGAAPLEFSNNIGSPLVDGLIFVHSSLMGFGLRGKIRIIASGKVTSGFGLVKRFALGADMCNSARAMMMALGCIQALKCNSNRCPVGVATQDPNLVVGLVPEDKSRRVANFHRELIHSLGEILGAMGLASPDELRPWHIMRRVSSTEVKHYGEIYDFLCPGELLERPLPRAYERAFNAAAPETFSHVSV